MSSNESITRPNQKSSRMIQTTMNDYSINNTHPTQHKGHVDELKSVQNVRILILNKKRNNL